MNKRVMKPLCSEVKPWNGKPTLFVNGKPEYPMIYALTDLPGGRLTYEEMPQHNIKRMYDAGVRIFYFCLFFDSLWREGRDLDLSEARKQVRGITDVCPDAKVMIRLHVHPPVWWYKRHPAECVKYADTEARDYDDGSRFKRVQHNDPVNIIRYSFASAVWRKTMSEQVAEFCGRMSSTPEGARVMGIQVAGGIYGEWHYWGFISNYPDVSLPMQRHFRSWLKKQYKTPAQLQNAWGKKRIGFKEVNVPGVGEREACKAGLFLDLPSQQNLADYYKCQHELVADNLIHFAKTVKQSWGRPIITGAFYGYCFPVFMRETVGGHLELQKVLKSPHVDYLSAPQAYWPDAEKPGDAARSRGLVTSCRLNGKLWLDEYDSQVDLRKYTSMGAGANVSAAESVMATAIAVVRRNMSVSATQGQGFWFFDFGVGGGRQYEEARDNGSNGWWDFPAILSDITTTRAVFEKQTSLPYRSNADVLMVYDTESFYYCATNRDLLTPVFVTNYWISSAVWKAGVAADYVHLDDLDKVDMRRYRVVVFNNTYRITNAQRKVIKEKVLKANRNVVWFYAPGYLNGRSRSLSSMKELTGLTLKVTIPAKACEVRIRRGGFTHQYGLDDKPLNPLFYVDDKTAETIGTYSGSNKTAIARKEMPGFTSWYVGLPEYGDTLMNYLLAQAGAHRYGDQGEIIYTGNNMLVVHSVKAGEHVIHLNNGKDVTCHVPEGGATLIFDPESGEVLLPASPGVLSARYEGHPSAG